MTEKILFLENARQENVNKCYAMLWDRSGVDERQNAGFHQRHCYLELTAISLLLIITTLVILKVIMMGTYNNNVEDHNANNGTGK